MSERTAWIFPGQGMLRPRAGLALARREQTARRLLEHAEAQIGRRVEPLLARGELALYRTSIQQPLLTAISLGAWSVLRREAPAPDIVAGHSLGEIAAWAATGAISPKDAVTLARQRGELMERAGGEDAGAMLAVLADAEAARAALAFARRHGDAGLAAENGPEEWVLSGARSALAPVAARYPSRWLEVSGAWHAEAMAPAVAPLREALRSTRRVPPATPMVSCMNGEVVDPDEIPDLLAEQVIRPVRWTRVVDRLLGEGVSRVVTVGPGRVLRGLVRKCVGARLAVLDTESPRGLDETARLLWEAAAAQGGAK